ncbi:hypothetical protein ARMGADRAFT_179395 [Armillaria gallica]|uniref:Uncharacterized protein n=1 Tax=Armillaria gallica TaxID=47427 RepID=A0A2H3DA92_ARMGA|nr:hypothetical protein ARMGADRAFT_179395 [Armillaria gallica]
MSFYIKYIKSRLRAPSQQHRVVPSTRCRGIASLLPTTTSVACVFTSRHQCIGMAPFNSLPAELIDAIIYEFRHDHESLKSLASAHRSFIPFAQNYIFSTVSLSFRYLLCSDRSRCTQLLKILSSSPHIVSFVCDLHIFIAPTPPHTLPHEVSRENSPQVHILHVLSGIHHIRVFRGAENGWSIR